MKQTRDGKRVTNWHRPIAENALKNRYRRHSEEEAPDAGFDTDYYDDDDDWGATDVEVMMWDLTRQLERDRVLERDLSPFAAADSLNDLPLGPSPDQTRREIRTIPPEELIDDLHEFLTHFLRKWSRDRRAGIHIAGIADIDASELSPADCQIFRQVLDENPQNSISVVGMVIFSRYWIRWPAEFWQQDYPDDIPLIDALGLHLFSRYEIPACLIGAWRGIEDWSWRTLPAQCICWYLLHAQGASQHKAAKKFDWDIGKKFTSCLFQVPADTPLEQAPYFAECLRLGAPPEVAERLAMSGEQGGYEMFWNGNAKQQRAKAFWQNFVQWMARYFDEFEDAQIDVIWRWSQHRHIEAERIGETFSMSGRSPARVLEEAEDYIQQIQIGWGQTEKLKWNARGWDWRWQDPINENAPIWSIIELTNSEALREEGRALHHCVGSYSRACFEGRSAIFSLRSQDRRVATIEIRIHNRDVAQARGSCNRVLTPREQSILGLWKTEILKGKPRRNRKIDD